VFGVEELVGGLVEAIVGGPIWSVLWPGTMSLIRAATSLASTVARGLRGAVLAECVEIPPGAVQRGL